MSISWEQRLPSRDSTASHRGTAPLKADPQKARAQVNVDGSLIAPNRITGMTRGKFIAHDSVGPPEPVDNIVVQLVLARVFEQRSRHVLQRRIVVVGKRQQIAFRNVIDDPHWI